MPTEVHIVPEGDLRYNGRIHLEAPSAPTSRVLLYDFITGQPILVPTAYGTDLPTHEDVAKMFLKGELIRTHCASEGHRSAPVGAAIAHGVRLAAPPRRRPRLH